MSLFGVHFRSLNRYSKGVIYGPLLGTPFGHLSVHLHVGPDHVEGGLPYITG